MTDTLLLLLGGFAERLTQQFVTKDGVVPKPMPTRRKGNDFPFRFSLEKIGRCFSIIETKDTAESSGPAFRRMGR